MKEEIEQRGKDTAETIWESTEKPIHNEILSKKDIEKIGKVMAEKMWESIEKPVYYEGLPEKEIDLCITANLKGLSGVLLTSAIYKVCVPMQDIRYHQKSLEDENKEIIGYSGRGFDTNVTIPFLKAKGLPCLKETSWLTRTLEQPYPYIEGKYQAKIGGNEGLSQPFLKIIAKIQESKETALQIGTYLMKKMHEKREKSKIECKIPNAETLEEIKEFLEKFINHKNIRKASKLPVIAIYSLYQTVMPHLKLYDNLTLKKLNSHFSPDSQSGMPGDIAIQNENDEIVEILEIKHQIEISEMIINDGMTKIDSTNTKPKRVYFLSTKKQCKERVNGSNRLIKSYHKSHKVIIIVNGVIDTIIYYLRLVDNPELYLKNLSKLIETDEELEFEHRATWNKLCQES